MSTPLIFLITPKNTVKYKEMLIYANTIEEARHAASAKINPLKKVKSSADPIPLMDTVYLEESTSTCIQISPDNIEKFNLFIRIKYRGNQYDLVKDFAMETK